MFTDLDATLLDHDDYAWQAAAPALTALAERRIPVCFVTSKTAAELVVLRRDMGNVHPFAVENGGAAGVPRGYFEHAAVTPATPVDLTALGADYAELRGLAERLRGAHGYRFTGFGEMDTEAVVAATGLDPAVADAARERRASEPLLWADDDAALADFRARVDAAGYATRIGGRFVHLLGRVDKGDALRWLRARFEAAHGPIFAIALGDSANDVDMLAAADIGYWVARPDGSYHAPAGDHLRHAPGIGPAGWAAAIEELIDEGKL